uniref:Secreted protein n=1 Tax=Pararge aegeria TaxID=116150 RepID=S4PK40_9NEOP
MAFCIFFTLYGNVYFTLAMPWSSTRVYYESQGNSNKNPNLPQYVAIFQTGSSTDENQLFIVNIARHLFSTTQSAIHFISSFSN